MIDMCVDGARVVVEKWKAFLMSPAGVYLYSVVTGAAGIVMLMVFFSMVLSTGAQLLLLPCIIGFNCASAGYGMMEKCRNFPKKYIGLATIAALLAAVGCTTAAIMFPWEVGTMRFVIALGAALGGTWFGAWIAGKKYAMKARTERERDEEV